MTASAATPVKDMSFEQALKELESIVRALESGESDLERAIADYSRGNELKEHCLKKLTEAKLKVEKISLNQSGDLATMPFETDHA